MNYVFYSAKPGVKTIVHNEPVCNVNLDNHKEMADVRDKLLDIISESEEPPLHLIPIVINDAAMCYYYANYALSGKRFPEGEATIATDPQYAFQYATDIIEGRWPRGEAAIAGNSRYAYQYAYEFIKGRWPEGEEAIATDASFSFSYARAVLNERFLPGEHAMATRGDPAYIKEYEKEFGVKFKLTLEVEKTK